jgi:hypothetical protein
LFFIHRWSFLHWVDGCGPASFACRFELRRKSAAGYLAQLLSQRGEYATLQSMMNLDVGAVSLGMERLLQRAAIGKGKAARSCTQ